MLRNPYTPGAGKPPAHLAGRDEIISAAASDLDDLINGYTNQSKIFYGLRGVGKTVLLNAIENEADNKKITYEHIEISENGNFKATISMCIIKLLKKISFAESGKALLKKALGIVKAFNITYNPKSGEITFGLDEDIPISYGTADTSNFQNDVTELFLALGNNAKKLNKPICIFIDEIQYLKKVEFEGLIGAVHRLNQKNLPILFFGSGLPLIAKYAADIKSYSERLFRFIPIDSLRDCEAVSAIIEPAKLVGVNFDQETVKKIICITEGYPYFIQEFGRQIWKFVDNKNINSQAVEKTVPLFNKSLDESFFKSRFDRATPKEKEFMYAMVDCGTLPCTLNNVALIMEKKVTSISPLRGNLINKGFIFPTSHGEIDFTVPQFDLYLKRIRTVK